MKRFCISTIFVAALVSPVLADDDDELGAYLYKADCDSLSSAAIVHDLGDLDSEYDASREWQRLDMGDAPAPHRFRVEDESVKDLKSADFERAGYAVAIHAQDSKDADVIACGDLIGTVPFTADLAEVNNSGFAGRVAVEKHKKGVRFTTGAFHADAVK